jgi:hypothetical protein
MLTWYSTPARRAALITAAEGWVGTPFRANSAVRGPRGGVSCHNLVAELYFESGYMPRFEVPRGHPRALLHQEKNNMLVQLDAVAGDRLRPVEIASLSELVRSVMLHLIVVLDDARFVHVDRGLGVEFGYRATIADRIAAVRRPAL